MDDERIEAFLRAVLGLEGSSKLRSEKGCAYISKSTKGSFPTSGEHRTASGLS